MLKVELIGRLGYDAQAKTLENGKSQVNMSVAHSEFSKDQQGNRLETTLWVNVTWYSDGGNMLQYLKKGASVFIRGRQRVNVYQDKKGDYVAGISITVSEIELIGLAQKKEGTQFSREEQIFPNRNTSQQQVSANAPEGDDLPF